MQLSECILKSRRAGARDRCERQRGSVKVLSNNGSAGAALVLMRRMGPKQQPDTRRAKQV